MEKGEGDGDGKGREVSLRGREDIDGTSSVQSSVRTAVPRRGCVTVQSPWCFSERGQNAAGPTGNVFELNYIHSRGRSCGTYYLRSATGIAKKVVCERRAKGTKKSMQ